MLNSPSIAHGFASNIFEDLHNPAAGAGALLRGLAKRKDIVQPVLAFTIQILQQSSDPCEVEGALRMIGELNHQLTKSKKYKKDVERMLDALIISRLRDPSKFVRARAAWCLKEYSDAHFHTKSIIVKVVDGLIQIMCDANEELPVKVESALAIQSFLEDQERAHAVVKPHVRTLVLQILEIVSKAQIDDVISVVDELLEQFVDEVIPVAAEVAEHLSNLFLEILTSDTIDDRTPALNSIIPTLGSILDLVEDHREVMVHVEASVLKPINCILTAGHIEFYDDVIILLQSLLQTYVSEPMWAVYNELYKVFKTTDRQSILPFSDIAHVLHMYIVTDNESFLAFPERMNAMIDMCQVTLQEDDSGDENHLYAAKILETIILECGTHAAEVIPTIIVTVLRRLMKPSEEGLSELRPLLFLVIVAALYTCTELSLNYIHQIAEPNQNPLDYICEELVELNKKFEGIHNRRLALFGICVLFLLPSSARPTLINTNPRKVLEASLAIFDNLQRALKTQAQNRKDESGSEESEAESDDEGDTVAKPKKGARHRKVQSEHLSDDEDEIDEMSLDYIDAMAKECKRIGGESDGNGDDDGDSDSAIESSFFEETDTEQFATKFDDDDGPDVFVFFKQTMEQFENREPELFAGMVGNLSPETAESLQNLIKRSEADMS
ncbi:hypothetical protein ANCDUO_02753 [Ancylostoma duodenale]|uniref:Uncharacterized protein n=1 Tax=Ancylostoma duodenale TaxID=51022 RepID=A0A0C2DB16_9BILA|nr:hypothetical protein ANCDUO_02753 [Ancylostoma duodenale]